MGSHTLSHPLLPGLPVDEIQQELEGSKSELEARLGLPYKPLPIRMAIGILNAATGRAGRLCLRLHHPARLERCPHRPVLAASHDINATDSFSEFTSAVSGFGRQGMRPSSKILEISNYLLRNAAGQTNQAAHGRARERGAVCEVMNINESRRSAALSMWTCKTGGLSRQGAGIRLRGYRLHTHVNAESVKGYGLTSRQT